MALDLFAGIAVSDYAQALQWYERMLGAPPAFFPNDTEAVWEVTEHGYVYIVHLPDRAGSSVLTLFAEDFDHRMAQISERGIEPAVREIYDNGVRKTTFRDADGNEIGFGGAPVEAPH